MNFTMLVKAVHRRKYNLHTLKGRFGGVEVKCHHTSGNLFISTDKDYFIEITKSCGSIRGGKTARILQLNRGSILNSLEK